MAKLLLFGTFLLSILSIFAQNDQLYNQSDKVTKVAGGYKFTEGPAVAPDGRVFFTDQPNNKIFVWNEMGNVIETFLNSAERSNGTYFDKKGNLLACADL